LCTEEKMATSGGLIRNKFVQEKEGGDTPFFHNPSLNSKKSL